jgi:hypothetical protein
MAISAARTTDEEIRKILNFDTSIEDLDPFIEAANELVTEICEPEGYSDTRLRQIELWLSAHFIAIRDPRYQSEGFGGASGTYQGQTAMNLSATTYGQQAMLLDTAGGLARLDKHIMQGKRGTIGITYLGTEPDRSTAYPWRFYALYND